MPKIGANFDFKSAQPNFKRDQFDTIADMKAYDVCDDGHVSYCKADGKRYEFKAANSVDATTGKWREYVTGGNTDDCIKKGGTGEQQAALTATQMAAANSGVKKGSGTNSIVVGKDCYANGNYSSAFGSGISLSLSIYEGCIINANETKSFYINEPGIEYLTSEWYANQPELIVVEVDYSNCIVKLKNTSDSSIDLSSVSILEFIFPQCAIGVGSHVEGAGNNSNGEYSHAEGTNNTARGYSSHVEGEKNLAYKSCSHAEGYETTARGDYSHSEGIGTTASGEASHAEGTDTTASGDYSHAEGYFTTASGTLSHVEGEGSQAMAAGSHAEGAGTKTCGSASHAEGKDNTAWSNFSHAEGYNTKAGADVDDAIASHAEGEYTQTKGYASHAEGRGTLLNNNYAGGEASHVEGYCTKSNNKGEHAEGQYNQSRKGSTDADKTIHSVGIGVAESTRTNAHEIMKNGDHYFGDGNLKTGQYGASNNKDIVSHSGGKLYANGTEITISGGGIQPSTTGGQTAALTASQMLVVNASIKAGSGTDSIVEGGLSKWSAYGENSHAEGYKENYPVSTSIKLTITSISEPATGFSPGGNFGGNCTLENGTKDDIVGLMLDDNWLIYSSSLNGTTISFNVKNISNSSADIYPTTYTLKQNHASMGTASHVEGKHCLAIGNYSHAEGSETEASGSASHAEGINSTASGSASHAEGINSTASGLASHAEGNATLASGSHSHAEGNDTLASGLISHAEGNGVVASGLASHAEGTDTTASGDYSHAEGYFTTASGTLSHVEGEGSQAMAAGSHAEGAGTKTCGDGSHAEGKDNTAWSNFSHAEGYNTKAGADVDDAIASHAEGEYTQTKGYASHAEGRGTLLNNNYAGGEASHVEGYCTKSNNKGEHAEGQYNQSRKGSTDADKTIHSVGIGSSDSARANAHEIMVNGDNYIKKLYLGQYGNIDTPIANVQDVKSLLDAIVNGLYGQSSSNAYAPMIGKYLLDSNGKWTLGSSAGSTCYIPLGVVLSCDALDILKANGCTIFTLDSTSSVNKDAEGKPADGSVWKKISDENAFFEATEIYVLVAINNNATDKTTARNVRIYKPCAKAISANTTASNALAKVNSLDYSEGELEELDDDIKADYDLSNQYGIVIDEDSTTTIYDLSEDEGDGYALIIDKVKREVTIYAKGGQITDVAGEFKYVGDDTITSIQEETTKDYIINIFDGIIIIAEIAEDEE